MTESKVTELYSNSTHEVAVHGYKHAWLDRLPTGAMALEVIRDKDNLEKQFGRIIRGMAYAYGTYNDQTVECLRSCGIVYSRTVNSTEKFDIPTDWLRLPATCHHRNPKLMELAKKFVEMNNGKPQLFYLWGHTYEFEQNDNWNVIEEFAEYISGKDDIWYATNIDIYDYIDDYNRLQFSADLSKVHNPTARTLCFTTRESMNAPVIYVAPGETVAIND